MSSTTMQTESVGWFYCGLELISQEDICVKLLLKNEGVWEVSSNEEWVLRKDLLEKCRQEGRPPTKAELQNLKDSFSGIERYRTMSVSHEVNEVARAFVDGSTWQEGHPSTKAELQNLKDNSFVELQDALMGDAGQVAHEVNEVARAAVGSVPLNINAEPQQWGLEEDLIEKCWHELPDFRTGLFLVYDYAPFMVLVEQKWQGITEETNDVDGHVHVTTNRELVRKSIDACYIVAWDYTLKGEYRKAMTMVMSAGLLIDALEVGWREISVVCELLGPFNEEIIQEFLEYQDFASIAYAFLPNIFLHWTSIATRKRMLEFLTNTPRDILIEKGYRINISFLAEEEPVDPADPANGHIQGNLILWIEKNLGAMTKNLTLAEEEPADHADGHNQGNLVLWIEKNLRAMTQKKLAWLKAFVENPCVSTNLRRDRWTEAFVGSHIGGLGKREWINLCIVDDAGKRHIFHVHDQISFGYLVTLASDKNIALKTIRFRHRGKMIFASSSRKTKLFQLDIHDGDEIQAELVAPEKHPPSKCKHNAGKQSKGLNQNSQGMGGKRMGGKRMGGKKKQPNAKPNQPRELSIGDYKRMHCAAMEPVLDEAREKFKKIRVRIDALTLDRTPRKVRTARKAAVNELILWPGSPASDDSVNLGKKAFHILVGEETNLYNKWPAKRRLPHRLTLDLRGLPEKAALEELDKTSPIWLESAMRGDYPFVLPVDIICGSGNHILSQVVGRWIRDNKNVAIRPKGIYV